MFESKGRLNYHNSWLIIGGDEELGAYYRKLISMFSPSTKLQLPLNGAHVTVIAGKYECANQSPFWGKYQGEIINFSYDPNIQEDGTYFWLTVHCPRIEAIRTELGLKPTIKWPWHLTIGNLKHV